MTDVAKTDGFAARAFIRRIGAFAPVIFLLALMIVFTILEPRFVSSINLFNVMRQISITGLVAIGMTFVILTAGIDLSVGSLLALAGLAAATPVPLGAPITHQRPERLHSVAEWNV